MAVGLEAAVDRACGRWVAWVARHPGRVLAAVAAATLACGAYAAVSLGVNADPRTLIDPRLPFQVRQREVAETFHSLADGVLVVVDADSPTAAGRAADALGARLAARTDLFREVDVPGGGPFFARNALLFLTPAQLEELTDRLSRVQPFLAELARDQSLVGVSDLLREALAAGRERAATGLDLGAVVTRVSAVAEAVAEGRRAPDPWGSAVLGGTLPPEARTRVVALRPLHPGAALASPAPELAAIRAAARDLGLGPERGVRVRISGEPVMNYEELGAVATQSWHVALVSVVLFAAAVVFALRSPRAVLALVGSLLVSLVWSNGVAAAAVRDLNVISAAFNVLIVGLGGEFGIHFAMRWMELASRGRPRHAALVETAETVGGSLLSSAVTTSIGFFIFLLTDFTGVAQLGFIAGTGMFLSLASTLTVLPALLAVGRAPVPPRARAMPAWLARLERVPLRHARVVRVAAAAVGVAALALLPRIRFDYNLVRLHDPGTESVATFEELLGASGTTPWTADVVAPSLDAARALAVRLAALPTVAGARTLLDFVPAEQEEKRATLETASFFVPAAIVPGPPRTQAERRAALARLADEARRSGDAPAPLGPGARRLAQALARVLAAGDGAVDRLERDLVGSLPAQVEDLQRLVAPARVTLADLPADVTQQMLAADGRARIQVIPREDVGESRALERFVRDVRTLAPDASGLAVYTFEWGRVTWTAMLLALGGGVACMLVALVVLWRSLWDALLAFFPLALAAVLTCAALVVLGQPFNFANVIVLPMLIGMSIDSGVHLVHRHRTDPGEEDVLATSTGRAVFYSALTTMLSFGSLGFAPHRGIAAIGQLLTVGVGLVLVCYVVVLPAVLEWDDRRRRGGSGAAPSTGWPADGTGA
jgi:hopanoid biosynthesis associated RND transporter like protein HpnN